MPRTVSRPARKATPREKVAKAVKSRRTKTSGETLDGSKFVQRSIRELTRLTLDIKQKLGLPTH